MDRQVRLLDHAVPMPIVVKTRTYDQNFYDALRDHPAAPESADADPAEEMEDLFY